MALRIGSTVAGVGIAAVASFAVLQLWSSSGLRDAKAQGVAAKKQTAADKLIKIVEATYGMNCKDFKVPPGAKNSVHAGNVTSAVVATCDKKDGSCSYKVDEVRLGDPAQTCPKDFAVRWQCGNDKTANQAILPGEAHGKSINISCPPK